MHAAAGQYRCIKCNGYRITAPPPRWGPTFRCAGAVCLRRELDGEGAKDAHQVGRILSQEPLSLPDIAPTLQGDYHKENFQSYAHINSPQVLIKILSQAQGPTQPHASQQAVAGEDCVPATQACEG